MAGCGRVGYDPLDRDAADGPDPLLAGCVVDLRMDEPAWVGSPGEVVDWCGGDDPGTATGGATTVADPVRGRVGIFSGGTSCVVIPDRPPLRAADQLTMSAWVYPTALDGSREFGVVSKRVDYQVDNAYSMFLWTGDHVWVDLDTEDNRFDGAAVLVNDRWQQITVVYDGREPAGVRARVFVDGALDLQASEDSAVLTPFTADLYVGCLPLSGPAQAFAGRLDDVVVWTRALAPGEVTAWYDATRR